MVGRTDPPHRHDDGRDPRCNGVRRRSCHPSATRRSDRSAPRTQGRTQHDHNDRTRTSRLDRRTPEPHDRARPPPAHPRPRRHVPRPRAGGRRRLDARRRPAQRRRRPRPEPERPQPGWSTPTPSPWPRCCWWPAPSATASAGGARCWSASSSSALGSLLSALRPLRRRAHRLPGPHRHRRRADHARHPVDHHQRVPARGAGPGRRHLGRASPAPAAPSACSAPGGCSAHFSWPSIFFVTAVGRRRHVLRGRWPSCPTTRSSEHVGLDPLGTVLSALGIGGARARHHRRARSAAGPPRSPSSALVVGRGAGRRLRAVGAAHRAPAARPAAVPLPRLRHRLGLAARAVHRPVRDLPGDPPVPAAAPRLQRAEVRRGPAADDVRDDPGLDRGRARCRCATARSWSAARAWPSARSGVAAFATLDAHSGFGSLARRRRSSSPSASAWP